MKNNSENESQDKTKETYIKHFDLYKQNTPNEVSGEFVGWMDNFIIRLPQGGKVLEIGAAIGRDARYMRHAGLDVLCVDIIPEALENLKADGFSVDEYDFNNKPKKEWSLQFDGIHAKAVFLHAEQKILEERLRDLAEVLKAGGYFCLSFKLGMGESVEADRKMPGERYFKFYSKEELEKIINDTGLYDIVDVATTSDGKWVQIILRLI